MKKRTPTILVVEDDPNDQFLLVRGFKKVGVTTPIHVVDNIMTAYREVWRIGMPQVRILALQMVTILVLLISWKKEKFDFLMTEPTVQSIGQG